jgi:eukaryotic-like serine/threonine-protein kinase
MGWTSKRWCSAMVRCVPPGFGTCSSKLGALAEAHNVGLIHRDVKPANIMLCGQPLRNEVAKLLDFGLVKDVASSSDTTLPDTSVADAIGQRRPDDASRTRTGVRSLTGTPLYMAPEAIARPGAVEARSDLYSLGAVAYFLLVGEPVFSGGTVGDICEHHLYTEPIAPSVRLGRPVPAGLEQVVLRCLEKDIAQRFGSASALADELTHLHDVEAWTARDAQEWWRSHSRPTASTSQLPMDHVQVEPRARHDPASVLTISMRDR